MEELYLVNLTLLFALFDWVYIGSPHFVMLLLVSTLGRKILLIVGAVFMSFSLISLGIYFQLQTAHSSYVNEMESINFEMMNTSSVLTATNHGGEKCCVLFFKDLFILDLFCCCKVVKV